MRALAKWSSAVLSVAAVAFATVVTKVMVGEMEVPSELKK